MYVSTAPGLGARLIGATRNQAIITIVISAAIFVALAGVARWYGGTGLGEYTVTSLSVYIVGAVAAIGVPVTVAREAAYLEERHEHGAASKAVGVGLLVVLILATIAGTALGLIWEAVATLLLAREVVPGPALFTPGMVLMAEIFFAIDLAAVRPVDQVRALPDKAFLFIHCEDDRTVYVHHAHDLRAASADPESELWIAPDCGHVQAITRYPDEWRARVLAFLERELGR